MHTASTPSASTRHSTPQAEFQGAFCDLMPELQRAISKEGYEQPTPIQEQCIPHLLGGRDLVGCAQTGTGKTAAFALPLLQQLAQNSRRSRNGTPRALILAPTRELAAQIGKSMETYGRFLHLRHTVVFGGVSQYHQVKSLRRGVHILVATPGRLLDLMQQGHIHLDEVEVFILDEVDRMLDMGFIHDIKRVLKEVPEQRQTLFFSATLAPKAMEVARNIVRDPVRVTIAPEAPAVDRITQKVLFVGKRDKDALLSSLLDGPEIGKAIVFTQMKYAADRVVKKLSRAGIKGISIHGNKSQGARTKALDGFRRGRFRVLVATDVAARGLDVDDITHVINYDLPVEAETYVHRIGRTARAGADGDAISFCSADQRGLLQAIERLLGEQIPPETDHGFHCDKTFQERRQPARRQKSGNGKRRPRGYAKGNFPPKKRNRKRSKGGRRNGAGRSA